MKILVPYSTPFNEVSNISSMFKKIIPILQSKINVQLLWVSYQPEKISSFLDTSTVKNLDLRNYNTAVELIKREKPDLIFLSPYESHIDSSFSYAAKSLKIPTAGLIYYQINDQGTKDSPYGLSLWKMYLRRIFSNYVISESQSKKTLFRRGKFIFYKFNFFLKTIISTNFSFLKKISIILFILKLTFFPLKVFNKKLSLSLHLVGNENIKKHLLENGVPLNTIKVTGNPMFDDYLYNKNNYSKKISSKPINVLLLPISFEDQGTWTKEQSYKIFKDIVSEISKNNDMNLTIKLHPTSSNDFQYKSIVETIDPTLKIFKEGSVEKYLKDVDVVLSYYSWSSSTYYPLFMGIPIIVCNFYNFIDDIFINRKLAIECKTPQSLINSINHILTENPATADKIDAYVKDYFHRLDGKAANRISDEILKFFKK